MKSEEEKRIESLQKDLDRQKAAQEKTAEQLAAMRKDIEEDMKALRAERERVSKMMEMYESGQESPMQISEIGRGKPVERVSENPAKDIELAEFMNQLVDITISPGRSEEDLPVVVFTVNGINQAVVRGVSSKIKRKYLEVLARSRTTTYTQRTNQNDLTDIELVPMTSVAYPFQINHDPDPRGFAWVRNIQAQP